MEERWRGFQTHVNSCCIKGTSGTNRWPSINRHPCIIATYHQALSIVGDCETYGQKEPNATCCWDYSIQEWQNQKSYLLEIQKHDQNKTCFSAHTGFKDWTDYAKKKEILTNFVSLRFLDIKMATIPVTMLCEFQRTRWLCHFSIFIVSHSASGLKAADFHLDSMLKRPFIQRHLLHLKKRQVRRVFVLPLMESHVGNK